MIVVFDSGVLISALNFGGTPLEALRHAFIRGSVAYCDEIDYEVRKALALKFNWIEANVDEALKGITEVATLIKIAGTLKGICRDPKDDMILECAQIAKANYIVSGDRDLLVLRQYDSIGILTPRAFLDEA